MDFKGEVLVVGSGISGLMYAIKVAKYGKVIILTKKTAEDSNTNLAQGGIASAIDISDSFELHVQDTLRSGGGLCNEDVVNKVVSSGPEQIKKLIDIGVNFSKRETSSSLNLGREGGHSKNRIVHAQDMTGREIERVLLEKIKKIKNILLLEEHIVIDLAVLSDRSGNIRCFGVYALDRKDRRIKFFSSKITVIASGGAGKIYLYSSNPDIATGDGVAMGYRAGATIANLEFVQFHPTCLYNSSGRSFLISETVRGDGGILVNSKGFPFMQKYDPMKELACRDVVARAIDNELKETGEKCVFLDISHKKSSSLKKRFPNLYRNCLQFGVNITKEPIPVVPSAHYMCGGIITDANAKTNIDNLYAVGEVACTGLHGANRLASNSLLEALVYADIAANQAIKKIKNENKKIKNGILKSTFEKDYSFQNLNETDLASLTLNRNKIRRIMWEYVGIIRSDEGLLTAQDRIIKLSSEIMKQYSKFKVSSNLIEFRNIAIVSELVVKSALLRKESRGLHYNLDYPERNDNLWGKNITIKSSSNIIQVCS